MCIDEDVCEGSDEGDDEPGSDENSDGGGVDEIIDSGKSKSGSSSMLRSFSHSLMIVESIVCAPAE